METFFIFKSKEISKINGKNGIRSHKTRTEALGDRILSRFAPSIDTSQEI